MPKLLVRGSHFENHKLKEISGFVSQQPSIGVLGQQWSEPLSHSGSQAGSGSSVFNMRSPKVTFVTAITDPEKKGKVGEGGLGV